MDQHLPAVADTAVALRQPGIDQPVDGSDDAGGRQAERALQRIDNGTYGVCESCGQPIGKARLQAFPRATLCVSCKQKEERR